MHALAVGLEAGRADEGIGRCEQAPAVVVGQHPVACATVEKVAGLVKQKSVKHPRPSDRAAFDPAAFVKPANTPGAITDIAPGYTGYAAYRKAGGLVDLRKFEGQPHTFITKEPGIPASRDAIEIIKAFVRERSAHG